MTVKERNLLKGAIRRVFSRSELRRAVIETSIVKGHSDPTRPRVKNWCICPTCKSYTPKSYMQVDHVLPIVPIDSRLEDMSWDTVVDRTWCDRNNLQPICVDCHKVKSKQEQKLRRLNKKGSKK
jgi:5-methylcytosine-specific restriction endonuclease McrA